MKAAIEAARERTKRTSELADEARSAQERHDVYAAQGDGDEMTSPARLRELKRASEMADARLRLVWGTPGSARAGDDQDSEAEPDGEQV